jgi:hypothetical protein
MRDHTSLNSAHIEAALREGIAEEIVVYGSVCAGADAVAATAKLVVGRLGEASAPVQEIRTNHNLARGRVV